MNNDSFFYVAIVIIGLMVLATFFFVAFDSNTKESKKTVHYDFHIYNLEGNVYYKNKDTNYSYVLLMGNKGADKNTWIKTENGKAKIVLRSGMYVVLGQNTELLVSDIGRKNNKTFVRLEQTKGKLWNRIFHFVGAVDYDVKIGNTVASVRGTGFSTETDGNKVRIGVGDGSVDVNHNNKNYDVNEGQEFNGDGNSGNIIYLEEDDWIKENLQNDEAYIKQRKEYYRKKYKSKIRMAKMFYDGITDELIEKYLDIAAREGIFVAKSQIEKDFHVKIPDKYLN